MEMRGGGEGNKKTSETDKWRVVLCKEVSNIPLRCNKESKQQQIRSEWKVNSMVNVEQVEMVQIEIVTFWG